MRLHIIAAGIALLGLAAPAPAAAQTQAGTVDPAVIYGVSYALTGFGGVLTAGGFYGDGAPDVLAYSALLYGVSQLVVTAAAIANALGPDPVELGIHVGVLTALNLAGAIAGIAGFVILSGRPDADPEEAQAQVRIAPGGLALSGVF